MYNVSLNTTTNVCEIKEVENLFSNLVFDELYASMIKNELKWLEDYYLKNNEPISLFRQQKTSDKDVKDYFDFKE